MDPTFHRLFAIFFLFGIWQSDDESNIRCMVKRAMHFMHLISLTIILLVCAIESNTAEGKCFLALCTFASVVLDVKSYFILWKKEEILTFLYDAIVMNRIINRDESAEVTKIMKKAEKFNSGYFYMMLFGLSIFIILPIVYAERILPGFIVFESENEHATILYYVAFAYITSCTTFAIIYCFLMLFIWHIMLSYSIEYKLLGHRFKGLSGATYHQDLIASVKAHRNLNEYLDRN